MFDSVLTVRRLHLKKL